MQGAGGHWRGLAWLLGGHRQLVPPALHPGGAPRWGCPAELSSGNALGFLGTMPECGEAREDVVLPGEALLPIPFPGWRLGRKPP